VESNQFLHNLLLFGRLLRGLGLDVNTGRMIDLVQALQYINISQRMDFYHASRTFLVHNREDIALFDQAFELFWNKPQEDWITANLSGSFAKRRPNQKGASVLLPRKHTDDHSPESKHTKEDPLVHIQVIRTYSSQELLRKKDFSEMSGEDLEAVKRFMRAMTFRLGERRTLRLRAGRGHQLDFRRSLRKSFNTGGEVLEWARREPKVKPRPLVIIADISGSMERYTRVLLHFIYGMAQSRRQPVEAFLFSTRLTRVTSQMKRKDVEKALGEVSEAVQDWAGGTRMGETLKTFNFTWGRRVLGRGAIVLFISDGWDRGDVNLLSTEMARLHRSCHRLIWLNPLLGSPDYQPLARGAKAALPHTDDFMPVHNLVSLEELARHLEKVSTRK
jgi:uncharacterized protein